MADDKPTASHLDVVRDEEIIQDDAPTKPTTQNYMTESRMQAALLRENPRAFRKSFLKLYCCIFVGYLCSATNGFDANTFGMCLNDRI
jgi:hypothetical protein